MSVVDVNSYPRPPYLHPPARRQSRIRTGRNCRTHRPWACGA